MGDLVVNVVDIFEGDRCHPVDPFHVVVLVWGLAYLVSAQNLVFGKGDPVVSEDPGGGICGLEGGHVDGVEAIATALKGLRYSLVQGFIYLQASSSLRRKARRDS